MRTQKKHTVRKEKKESVEHITTFRPWGSYTVIEEGKGYKIKRVTVTPGKRLSLQYHRKRSEHWVVVKGKAQVTLGGDDILVCEHQSIYIPKQVVHRLYNPAKTVLEIIEVQGGAYLGEDDIVRLRDDFGRKGS